MRRWGRLGRTLSAAALAVSVAAISAGGAGVAHADAIDKAASKLSNLEGDAGQLTTGLSAQRPQVAGDHDERRLVEAQVAYGMKNYTDASILLYDTVEKRPGNRVYRDSLFILADSLFHKGDYLSSRTYFRKLLADFGERHPQYALALARLVELSLRLHDDDGVQDVLARLERLATTSDTATYVRAKYLYSAGRPDEAAPLFAAIGATSQHYFQARYFLAVHSIVKVELATAAKILYELVRVQPKNAADKRIVELSHMALGRIHYEREQLSESVDQYLMINRKSDLFDDSLYEVAWVYVKGKEYDKALRALELLALANPDSARTPEVRILEGNLRIRKAKSISELARGNAREEYSKAQATFEKTRDAYTPARDELMKVIAAHADVGMFFDQITTQSTNAFDVASPAGPSPQLGAEDAAAAGAQSQPVVDGTVPLALPSLAVTWLREEAQVKRVVVVSDDLATIRKDLSEADALLIRIDRAVSSPSRVQIFPALADRRDRANSILSDANGIRSKMVGEAHKLADKVATPEEEGRLRAIADIRLHEEKRLTGAQGERTRGVSAIKQSFVELDKSAQELEVTITSIEAEITAMDRFEKDLEAQGKTKDAAAWATESAGLRGDVDGLRKELAAIRGEAVTGQDEAGLNDADAEKEARLAFEKASTDELGQIQAIGARMSSGDQAKLGRIMGILGRCDAVVATVERANGQIDSVADSQLVDIRASLVEEKQRLQEYLGSLQGYEGENKDVGTEVIASSFGAVSDKFYNIVVRADLGVVDVAWAQKEEAKGYRERMNLESAKEKKVLGEIFRESTEDPPPDPEVSPFTNAPGAR